MNKECSHKYVVLSVEYRVVDGPYCMEYKRITNYFCENCLDEVEKIKTESSRERPTWYKGNE